MDLQPGSRPGRPGTTARLETPSAQVRPGQAPAWVRSRGRQAHSFVRSREQGQIHGNARGVVAVVGGLDAVDAQQTVAVLGEFLDKSTPESEVGALWMNLNGLSGDVLSDERKGGSSTATIV